MRCMRALVSCGGVESTTTDRNKLTVNNADWLRRAILKTFYYPQSHLAEILNFVAKSLRRNGWFADSLFAVSRLGSVCVSVVKVKKVICMCPLHQHRGG